MNGKCYPFLPASLGLLVAGLLILTACAMPKGGAPICTYEELVRPEVTFPEMYAVIDDLTPDITWTFPGSDCLPEYTLVEVLSQENYLPGATAGYYVMGGRSLGTSFTWPVDNPLLPGSTYFLRLSPVAVSDGAESYGLGNFIAFSTGPLCAEGETPLPPSPRWLPDDWTVDPSPGFALEWDNEMACFPTDGFVVQLSRSRAFTRAIELTTPMEALWVYSFLVEELDLANCARYFWRVRPNTPTAGDESWSEIWSFTTHIPLTFCMGDIFGPWLEEEPIGIPPWFIPDDLANCRSGPTTDYPVLSLLPAGQQFEIRGRNLVGDAWQVFDPSIDDTCWVAGSLGESDGDTGQVNIIIPDLPLIPLPDVTAIPLDCSQWSNDQQACTANPACQWNPNINPTSPCVNK